MDTRTYRLETDYLDGKEVVTIKDSTTGRLLWSKTRSLTDDEVVSTVLDSHHSPRYTLHRPRQSVVSSTKKSAPPWPQYLVLRSPDLPQDRYIPLIEAESSSDRKGEADYLKFVLPLPRKQQVTPMSLNLLAHSRTAPQGEDESTTPLTPTQANPHPDQTSKRRSRPKSATYRVDMTPSLSRDSATSSSTEMSTGSTATRDSRDPLSEPPAAEEGFPHPPPPPLRSKDSTRIAKFRLQPFFPDALEARKLQECPKSFGSKLWGRVRSLAIEDGTKWSCVSEENEYTKEGEGGRGGEGDKDADNHDQGSTIMYFEEDPPGLFPASMRGTLSLEPRLIDESGYEPSFWIAVAMAWIECQGERMGWREGRGGD